ncbi:MAG: peptide ABC transporter ATPase [Peptococcaceae bacterium BICA1-8]|nr:MAG: peptide ABC transporter ATPase [Peptococcaceae bacterium BICA1-8]
MLAIKGLTVTYGSDRVLKGINLEVDKGDVLAVIGESGAGKTTLALGLMGLCSGRVEGQIIYKGRNLMDLSPEEQRLLRWNDLSMVFQDLNRSLNPVLTVFEQLLEPMLEHLLCTRQEAKKRANMLLTQVGLTLEQGDSYPHQLSGGEKQRVLIAMALTNDPDLLILDEPTAALDAITKVEIMQLLREVAVTKTVVLVTHDISIASKFANKLAVLYAGRIMEFGSTEVIIKNPRHPYTRGLLRSYPNMSTNKDLQGIPGSREENKEGCVFFNRCTQGVTQCQKIIPELLLTGDRKIACLQGGILTLLKTVNLVKRFSKVTALQGVSISISEGETVAIVGASGSGKTTLGRCIMGLEKADSGRVFFRGEEITLRNKYFYQKVQMIFQNPQDSISHRLNVLDAVCEPLNIQDLGSRQDRYEKAKEALKDVELPWEENFLKRYAHHLSGGELQRLAIARALVLEPKLLIADEPTSALDASVQAKIMRLLLNLQEQKGLSLMFITHDVALARKVCDKIFVMLAGNIVEEGSVDEVITKPKHPYTRDLINSAKYNKGL